MTFATVASPICRFVGLIGHAQCPVARSMRRAMAVLTADAAVPIASTSRLITWAARRMSLAMGRAARFSMPSAWSSRRLVSAARQGSAGLAKLGPGPGPGGGCQSPCASVD
jgi:hypothetical protein